jgi:hypothetical protein
LNSASLSCAKCNKSPNMAAPSSDTKNTIRAGTITSAVHIHFSRWMLILLAILVISPSLIVTAALIYPRVMHFNSRPSASPAGDTSQIGESKPGPWGRLLYADILIDLPDEFVTLPPAGQPPLRWFFQDYTKERIIELLRLADLTQEQIDRWLPDAAWEAAINGTWVTPDDEMILALNPKARSKIYSILVTFPENFDKLDPVWFKPETLDKQLDESGLSKDTIKLFKSLIYPNGSSLLLFTDKDTALRQIADDGEKRLFIKTITRKSTLLVSLKIDAESDVDALANYWGVGGRRKDVLPLMNSVQDIKGGWNLSIVTLLPSFIRDRLYTYPFPSADPQSIKQDCFWSAFNAFNPQPDDRLSDMQYAHEVLIKDYYSISQPSQLGDLIFLANSDNEAMHVATFIADDIVFTKNGFHYTQPWILMHMKDMLETYNVRLAPGKQLNVLYYRKKSL